MSLRELIEQRDAEVLARVQAAENLYHGVRELVTEIRNWNTRIEWGTEGDNGVEEPFIFLGMKMWPKKLNELHKDYVQDFRSLYMITLSSAQAEAMRLSVFNGTKNGGIKREWTYVWEFVYRQDGWVELLIGAR